MSLINPKKSKTEQRITTVSLDGDTWKIKNDMKSRGGNLSLFVRQCLLEWSRQESEVECFRETTERVLKCFPRPERLCSKCWPQGAPLRSDWLSYSGMIDNGDHLKEYKGPEYGDDAWIEERAKEFNEAANSDRFDMSRVKWQNKNQTRKPRRVKQPRFKRRLRWLGSWLKKRKS